MNRKTLCIVIALMVLSLGAILVAVEPELTGDVNRDGIVNIRHAEFERNGFSTMRVYAFEIRHLGEAD